MYRETGEGIGQAGVDIWPNIGHIFYIDLTLSFDQGPDKKKIVSFIFKDIPNGNQ